jgi:DNA-binding transcriptional MerR regulator
MYNQGGMKTDDKSNWISIGEASRIIGVTEVTLRQWSDNGFIKVFITPGGHRRYNIEEIQSFVKSHENKLGSEEIAEIISQDKNSHKEIGLSFIKSFPNYKNFSPEIIKDLGKLGQRTLGMVSDYVKNPDEYEKLLAVADEIGTDYGIILMKAELSLPNAVLSFVAHRTPILSNVMEILDHRNVALEDVTDAVPHIDKLLNQALTSMVKYYNENL